MEAQLDRGAIRTGRVPGLSWERLELLSSGWMVPLPALPLGNEGQPDEIAWARVSLLHHQLQQSRLNSGPKIVTLHKPAGFKLMTRDRWEFHGKDIFLHKAPVAHRHLKPVDFQLVVFSQSNLHEELADVLALVTLQLNHFSILGVLNYSTIAGKFLLEGLHQFLFIVVIRDALDCGEGLPAVALLDPYMDVVLSAGREQVITLTCIRKGVEGLEVLDSGHTIRFPSLGGGGGGGDGGGSGGGSGSGRRMLSRRRLE